MSSPRIQATTGLAPAIWGTTYLATTQLLPAGRPMLATVLRALPAGLVLIVMTRRLPEGTWWWRAFVLGALNIGAFFALLFLAAYRLPGPRPYPAPGRRRPDRARLGDRIPTSESPQPTTGAIAPAAQEAA